MNAQERTASLQPLLAYSLLASIAVLALAVRVHELGGASLWFDEALEFSRAASLRTALIGRPIDQDPPLYPLVNHFWIGLGRSEYWLRIPSALIGTATVFVAGGWAMRRIGTTTGLLLAALCAFAPSLVYYSRELNQYAALSFLGIVAFLACERLLRRGRAIDWAIFAAISVLGVTVHYGMVFPLAALGLYLGARVTHGGRKAERRRLVVYCLLLALVLVVLFFSSLPDQLGTPHLQRRFGGTHLQKELDYVMDRFWREVLVFFLFPFAGGPILWAVTGLALIAGLGAVRLWHRDETGRRLVGLLFLGSLALVYPADGLGLYPMGHRYVLFLAVPFFTMLACGFMVLARRSRALASVAATISLALFVAFLPLELLPNRWVSVPLEDLRPVIATLDEIRRPTEPIYVYYGALPAFEYYWPDPSATVIAGDYLPSAGVRREAERIAAAAGQSPIWLVVSHEREGELEGLLDALAGHALEASDWITSTNALAVRVDRSTATPGEG